MMRRTTHLLLASIALVAALAACRAPEPEAPPEGAIALETVQLVLVDDEHVAPPGIEGDLLRARVASHLRTRLPVYETATSAWEVFVRAELGVDGTTVTGTLAAIAETGEGGPEPIELVRPVSFEGETWLNGGRDLLLAEIDALADELCDALFIVRGSDDDVVQAIGIARPDLLAIAAREAQRRHLVAAVVPIVQRLNDADGDTLVVLIGALSSLGARDNVGDIIDVLDLDDPETLLATLPAVAAIGGAEASGFLGVLADAHRSARVRLLARELLAEMQP